MSVVEPGFSAGSVQKSTSPVRRSTATLKLLGATVCIAGVITTWVTMAETLQTLNKQYKSPFFMIYFVHSSYAIPYVGWAIWRYFPYCFERSYSCNKAGSGGLTNFRSLVFWSGVLGLLSFLQGYAWYLSLTRTNIPANTAIYQSVSAIVFVISVPLLKERVTVLKLFCVLVSIGGVFMVAFFSTGTTTNCLSPNITNTTSMDSLRDNEPCDPPTETSIPLGYVLLVCSVLCYAVYEVLYKKFLTVKDDPAASINGLRVLGYTGVHTLLWMWPPIIILHYSGFEPFQFPPTVELFGLLVANAAMDIVFFGCLLVCIALSSPLYASVGSILAIPTSFVVDLFVHHFLPSWQVIVGIVLILIGFIGFVISQLREMTESNRHKRMTEEQPLLDKPVETNRNWGNKVCKYLF